jgi:hypothetical protein
VPTRAEGPPLRRRLALAAKPTEWFDVTIDVRDRPPRGARLVFGLVNGDVKVDNVAIVQNLATAGGRIGTAVSATPGAQATDAGIQLNEMAFATKWIQQDVTVGTSITFKVGVSKEYQRTASEPYQPDQFSLAVLEASSNAGYLKSDDPTTANLVFSIDLAPGSQPQVYTPVSGTGNGNTAAWTVTVKRTGGSK